MYGLCKNSQNCLETGEEKCHKPWPPRMTDEEFQLKQAELLKELPEEFHSTLSYLAYERGHSAGHEEVINILTDLCFNLQKPIQAFGKRIRTA